MKLNYVVAALTLAGFHAAPIAAHAGTLDNLVSILDGMQDNTWSRVNVNSFLDAAPAFADRALSNSQPTYAARPESVVYAWSGFTWDSERGDLIIYGGGHANYAGNEVYVWDGATQRWGRGSLPSQVERIPNYRGEGNYVPIGGAFVAGSSVVGASNGPSSAHTYDNTNYLPIADRVLMLGGAAFQSGGAYTLKVDATTARNTGPFLWDPSKADPNKVGGATGTGVNPATQGGEMWQNRDLVSNNSTVAPGIDLSYISYIEGTSAVTQEGGKDVVYYTARLGGGTQSTLLRYVVNDVNDPTQDRLSIVGTNMSAPNAYGAAGYDPINHLYVAMGGNAFMGWDVDNAGLGNYAAAINPTVIGGQFTGSINYGIDFDAERGVWLVWGGGGTVWELRAPSSGNLNGQWILEKVADEASFSAIARPAANVSTGTLGKWKYLSDLHAFMALEDNGDGDLWIYRPEGWTNPVAVPEPSTYGSLAAGLGVLGYALRRNRRTRKSTGLSR